MSRNWQKIYRDALLEDTIPFWFPRAVDTEAGGFLHCFDRYGRLVDDDKGVWAQARMTWLLLTLFNTVEPRAEWLAWGQHGLDFIERYCFDTDGRMFFQVTRAGQPLRKRRYAYSEAFAAMAYAAHARATGAERSAARAQALFDFFTEWNFVPGRMPPKFTHVRPAIGICPLMIALVTAQELRANLGTEPARTAWIDRCVSEIEQYFVKEDIRCVMETVAPDGGRLGHFDGRLLNPGHAIEAAWFILHEGKVRQDSRLIHLGCTMLDWMWERGWDPQHGGLFYFCDVDNQPLQEYWHDMKFWWPHNEAVIASLLAFELTGDARYARMHSTVHDWAHTHFADPEHGEWFGYLHRDGTVSSELKGGLWKSAFHLPRMQWYGQQLTGHHGTATKGGCDAPPASERSKSAGATTGGTLGGAG